MKREVLHQVRRLEANHVIVVNRFYDTAARMDSIAEILDQLTIDESNLNEEELKFLQEFLPWIKRHHENTDFRQRNFKRESISRLTIPYAGLQITGIIG